MTPYAPGLNLSPIMSFLDHIRACNNGDPSRYRPFLIGGRRVGFLRPAFAELLRSFPDIFQVGTDRVTLSPDLSGPDERSAAVADVGRRLVAAGILPKPRGESLRVAEGWGAPTLMVLERKFISYFGVAAYGVHVNGFVRTARGLSLWIGTRAQDKDVAPGKLDNMIAGGLPAGLGLMDNLVKEAGEEADVPQALARTARPAGIVSYVMEDEGGLKPDTLFVYDLEVPEDFTPRNTDGETAFFTLMDVSEVARRVRDSRDFKFNVTLVITDFLIRHGLLSPETEPDYAEIACGLRRSLPAR